MRGGRTHLRFLSDLKAFRNTVFTATTVHKIRCRGVSPSNTSITAASEGLNDGVSATGAGPPFELALSGCPGSTRPVHDSWLDENELERYLDDAHWLVHIMNGSINLEKVYINIGMSCLTTIFDLHPDAVFDIEERRRRFKLLMSPFKRLNNVNNEVLTNRPFQLGGGMNIRDFAIVDGIKDLQRFAKPLREQ
jgi:hypothetical protein